MILPLCVSAPLRVKISYNIFVHVDFSMTIYTDERSENISHIAVNWRKNDTWFFSGGIIIAREFFTYEDLRVK